MSRNWRRVALTIVAVVIVSFIIGASDSVQSCLNKQPHSNADKSPNKGLSLFGFSVVSAHCVWFFFKDNSEPIIALATIALFIATYRLWRATVTLAKDTSNAAMNQLNAMFRQVDAMTEQGEWMKASAQQAGRAARAAGDTASNVERQANVAIETLEQMRRDFAVANRPRVRLRRIYFASSSDPLPMTRTPDGMGGYTEALAEGATPPPVIIEMANVGGVGVAKAKLRVTFIIFNTGYPEPGRIQDELARAVPQNMDVSHAGSGVLVVKVPAVGALFYDNGVLSGSQSVYCIGYTEYADETETLMGRTGFIRRCDIRNKWFERVDFPDFDYAD